MRQTKISIEYKRNEQKITQKNKNQIQPINAHTHTRQRQKTTTDKKEVFFA